MTTAAAIRPRPLRTIIGIVLITLGVCLLCWAAFNVARGPNTCGGDSGVACPDGFLPAVLGGFAAFFVVIPVGVVLSPKVAGLAPTIGTLIGGGLAAAVYAARFVADPVTESTVGTWIAVGIFGTFGLLSLLATLSAGPAAAAVASGSGAVAAAARAKAESASASARSTASSSGPSSPRPSGGPGSSTRGSSGGSGPASGRFGSGSRSSQPAADPGMTAIHDLLLHGLAHGELATKVEIGRIDPDHKADVQRLLDLHQRGVIDDDALRDALAALRTT